jgi:hydroxypyruvate reductase
MKLRSGRLVVNGEPLKLSRYKRLFLLAVGKASVAMMRAAIDILGNSPLYGLLAAPRGQPISGLDSRVKLFRASHPLPDQDGLRASRAVSAALRETGKDDLLICLISGGASAMLPSPTPDISLHDEQRLTELLIKSRATIHEINTVRRHTSTLKGGRLVQMCRAKTILSLIISDVPGNPIIDIASGLTAEDPTKYVNAIEVLTRHDLWADAPRTVKDHLIRGRMGKIGETPKPGARAFRRVHNIIIADARTACTAAAESLNRNGVNSLVLSSRVEMEAVAMGRFLASIAADCRKDSSPFRRGAVILGGETTVHVEGSGRGGRNQETVLSSVESIAGLDGVAVAALSTDGVDGNSKAAGALADGSSLKRAERKRLEPSGFLARNDSYRFFRALNDNLITGGTGTNVGDVYLMVAV